jgi:hypothetical protein
MRITDFPVPRKIFPDTRPEIGGCFDYTAEAIEPSYPGFDGLGRPRTDADP